MSAAFSRTVVYSVSQTGVLAYRMGAASTDGGGATTGNAEAKSLVWFGRNGGSTLVGESGSYAGIDLAPDGVRLAVHRHDGNGGDIWLYDPDQGGMQRWTFDVSQENSSPIWSPEGDRIAFASRREGQWGIWVKNVDGTGSETQLVSADGPLAPMSWAPNGEIVYWGQGPATLGDIWEVWVDSFPEPQGNRGQITNDGALWPRWRRGGAALELYYFGSGGMTSISLRVAGAAIQPAGPAQALFPTGVPNLRGSTHYSAVASYLRYAVSADGQRFLIPQPVGAPSGQNAPGGAAAIADFVRNASNESVGSGPGPGTYEIAIVLDWTRLLPEE